MPGTATCQLHMRSFRGGGRDLRRALAGHERFQSSRISWSTGARWIELSRPAGMSPLRPGGAPDGNECSFPRKRRHRDGCGAVHRLWRLRSRLPQRLRFAVHRRQVDPSRTLTPGPAGALPARASDGGPDGHRAFRGCTLYGECQEACPKLISIDTITRMNRDFLRASFSAGRGAVAESD